MQACGDNVDVWCFNKLTKAIEDFDETAGVVAEKLPTEQELKDAEKELDDLPPFRGWDDGMQAAMAAHWRTREAFDYGFVAAPPRPIAAISTPERDEGKQ